MEITIHSKYQIQSVVDAMKKTKKCRMLQRYQVVKLYLEGYSVKEIATIVERTSKTIDSYISIYLKSGLDGLIMKKPSGRPTFLSDDQKINLKEVVSEKSPEDVGFPAEMNWTSPLVKAWISRQFGIEYSVRGALKLLKELGFSCTRPTYTLAKADLEKQELFKKI